MVIYKIEIRQSACKITMNIAVQISTILVAYEVTSTFKLNL